MPISTANEPTPSQPRWKPRPKPNPKDLEPLPPSPAFLTSIDPAMNAALAPLDRIAADMERTWGVDRLIGLVSPDTAHRFAQAKRKLDLAIRANRRKKQPRKQPSCAGAGDTSTSKPAASVTPPTTSDVGASNTRSPKRPTPS